MKNFTKKPIKTLKMNGKDLSIFNLTDEINIDSRTVKSFGDEWLEFDTFSYDDIKMAGDQYFDIVPKEMYKDKYILDAGCGTGRWSKYLSNDAHFIEAIDPSDSVIAATKLLANIQNVRVSKAGIDGLPFKDNSFDFVFSLGVLHHIPDTRGAMQKCINKLKPGGVFLVYLYYNLDNRGLIFKALFFIANVARVAISHLPSKPKIYICDILAIIVYLPFIGISKLLMLLKLHKIVKYIPLSYYTNKSLNIIRNDSLDRFGTPLEQRYSKDEIQKMMESCGLEGVIFSNTAPFWHATGKKING